MSFHEKSTSLSSHSQLEYYGDGVVEEDELNRQKTIERIATGKTVEDVAREEQMVEEGIDPLTLDWEGAGDPLNPANWRTWKKWYVTYTVALICLCASLGSSLYVCGAPEISQRFHVSQELAIAGLTFYLLGLAIGPAVAAPLSELLGRRWIYLLSLPPSILFNMGVGLSQNIESILVLRFFTGLVVSPAMAVAGGTISDIWANDPYDRSFAMCLFCLAPFMGPILGPIVGGFAAEYKNWRWTLWISMMFSGAILIPVIFMPETYKPVLLASRAKKRGIHLVVPKMNLRRMQWILVYAFWRPIQMLIFEPIVSVLSIYIAFVFAVLFGFFEAFPIIFRGVYHMDTGISGLVFIGVGLGLVLGVAFYMVLDRYKYFRKNPDGTRGERDEKGEFIWRPPETKLLAGKVGAIALPISLFWLAWTSRSSVHWMVPTIAGVPFGFGLVLVFMTVLSYFGMSFPPTHVASALAVNNLLRYLLASAFPLFTVQMYERLHISWATTLLAFIALAMVPVLFIFERYGPRLRAKSRYGYAAYFKKLAIERKRKEAESQKVERAETKENLTGNQKLESQTKSSANESSSNEKVYSEIEQIGNLPAEVSGVVPATALENRQGILANDV
ncbi:hypothetical protein QFC19_003173 [Naganishia cerealis]|uniref:Uncharacterized protein n=1 Tax=Naganishia cerealis TaxID=610337 RepID=A0ACC2W4M6_9TREE|nr:hypothetical protein QFC19_003173 [Naganishia cerealis]